MAKNNIILNKIFTKATFNKLISENKCQPYSSIISDYLYDINLKNNYQIIKEIYEFMNKEYRNEYYYKNTLINKLLIGRRRLNTTTALTEVPIYKSKADFILINQNAVVYEIKTELDTLDRLEQQLSDYYKAFTRVCVVTYQGNYKKVYELLKDTNVGIYILTEKNTISVRKKSVEDSSYLEYDVIFKILRKNEFENILLDYYGELPSATPAFYYDECFKLMLDIEINKLHKYMLNELKKRIYIEKENFIKSVPYELKFLIYFSEYKQLDYDKLNKFLEKGFDE